MATTQIGRYVVQYASNTFPPRIWLYDTKAKPFGQLVFLPNGAALPQDSSESLFYHLADFQNVVDLLRNEKPVYFSFLGVGPGFENAIRTSEEPVGEAET